MKWLEDVEKEIGRWLGSTDVLRAASTGLRTVMPIAVSGNRVIVSRYDDVVAVLDDGGSFGVAEIYAEKMARTTGAFFLGMEDTPQYEREAAIARRAARKEDAARIEAVVRSHAEELIDRARAAGGTFDAVSEFSRLIPLRLVERYLGVPGPDPETMKRWMRFMFWDIFLNPNNDAAVTDNARAAGALLKPYLEGLIKLRKNALAEGQTLADDFVSRLLQQQETDASIDDDLIIRNIGGIIVGAVETQSKAIAHAIDQLLKRPDAFESARRACLANDDALLRSHIWEALRFNPHNPALFRTCRADTVIADGTPRRTVIRKGSSVVALTISAMFDPDALDRPNEFRSDRPEKSYLHFGHGQHLCFGSRINDIVLPAAIKPLLTLNGLAYADSEGGRIEYDGPFPNHMQLRFDASQ